MDGDPAVEPELDSFSLTLPLPYRVALVVVLGVWAWGANLHFLSLLKIDVPALLHYPPRTSPRTDPPHHLSTYRLASLLTIPLALSLFLFWILSHRNPTLVIYYDFLPISYLCVLLGLFLLPLRRFSSSGRTRFLTTLQRVSIGGLAQAHDGKFGDILLADVLTSYAKIIADLFVSLCMFFRPDGSATRRPDRGCGGQYLVPIIIAIPSLIRLRQCLIEYVRVRALNARNGGTIGHHGWGGQHLANALKYASAFPVILFSALQRNLSMNHANIGLTEVSLYRCWVIAVFVNSFYSFYWDVAKDWDLTLFSSLWSRIHPSSRTAYTPLNSHSSSSSTSASHPQTNQPFGLRPRLYLVSSTVYYTVITLDLLLRCTWSLKLSPHLDHFADFESGIFLMEFLEVGRRWIWIFFRVETEWVRNTGSGGGSGSGGLLGMGMGIEDGVLLGDMYGKDDEDD
ncbi:protein-ER retention protein-like protein [Mollisia scopiformis]|uniref:Protein-ER retention protein-like protein n=1 Tax=Mollisia scopiformis TaxID=149040 RepID=A0A194XT62_MOLSC|nr:protein-ER retention protein-like protein [Mollisia scopiformis]KUJ22887.1 protein-ER retention protein-like protein [Mollisia scopiformis]